MSPLDSTAPRILFAEDFDTPLPTADAVPEPEIIAPSFTTDDVDAARRDAWAAGHAAGLAEADSTAQALARAALGDVAAALEAVAAQAREAAEEAAEALAQVLADGMAALFPTVAATHGAIEAGAVVRAILPALRQEPRATIRVAPALVAAMEAELDVLDADLPARVGVIADGMMAPGDVRASWAGGSAVRDTAAVWREVAAILAQSGWAPATQPERVLADVE